MEELIKINGLTFGFSGQQVLKDLYAEFRSGEFSVILGRNGSGKSTLFNILSGMEREYKGEVVFAGIERKKIKPHQNAKVRIGFMPQFHHSTFPFKVLDVLLTGRAAFSKFSPTIQDKALVDAALESFGLIHLRDKPYTSLSGGERQLILLCRVLLQEPSILLLDEPTNHLDLHYQVAVLDHLKRLVKNGTTVICIMHDPNLALLYGDRHFLMNEGKLKELIADDPKERISALETTYQVKLDGVDYLDGQLIVPRLFDKK
ncbi:iron ABC transporter [Sphingobacterium mizutaii NBRC 14946 = DSM 11724]|uniref:Hemin import ATP-binding protein HmuV n=2 Tax=Sphingobacterium mizutaii TaxID=1010 RepID=A0AAJ5C1U3_9SPHI|nr:ABC transporter ATP-binding protein [Sphingobacterium mizutaii]GEM66641.1 iron ABC transporter [Sphingobacterium mizutaii NBRC 14946 = DSM 11724]SDL49621.1 iron complex transport system ATP-binding protein [Sphingobacterium mizutaii]SNV61044.1 Hemin import ATP-binding protein HmuV [Sphingobacterium mizutaii]